MVSYLNISSRLIHPFIHDFFLINQQVKATIENGPSACLSSKNLLYVSSFPSFHLFVYHIGEILHRHTSHIFSHFLTRPVEP